jgi:glycosyltransferase involved in cell wall biosynthesis
LALKKKMKDSLILRVGSFPTIDKPGMGLHASKLCAIDNIYTIFLAPREVSKRLEIKGKYELCEIDMLLGAKPIKTISFSKILFYTKRILSLIRFSFFGIWLIFFRKIDIVHIHSPMFFLIALAGFISKKRVYITFHGTDFHVIKNSTFYMLFGKIFTKVFAISPDMLDTLAKVHGKNNVILVANGIDIDLYKNHHLKRKKQIIAVGELKIQKGFEYLIAAFSNLIKKGAIHNYKLIIVGDGLLKESLQRKINDLNMSDFIHLLGRKKRDELINLYNQSEIFVLSSISEGFPKVLLEGMSCGCNIVSTNVGAVSKILLNTKLARPKVAEDLELSLKNCITSKCKPNIDLKKYSWDLVRKAYYKEYTRF